MTSAPQRRLPNLREPEDVMTWARDLLLRLNPLSELIDRFMPGRGRYTVLRPRAVVLANLPDARGLERVVILAEGGGVKTLIFSDGVVWRRSSDGSAV